MAFCERSSEVLKDRIFQGLLKLSNAKSFKLLDLPVAFDSKSDWPPQQRKVPSDISRINFI
jgi:hypothetical protein